VGSDIVEAIPVPQVSCNFFLDTGLGAAAQISFLPGMAQPLSTDFGQDRLEFETRPSVLLARWRASIDAALYQGPEA
jgi:hypothetical protein